MYFRRTNPARYWLAFSRSPSSSTFASRSRWYSCQVTLSTPGAAFFFSSPKLRLRFSGVSNRANPPNRCCLSSLALSAMAHREVGIAIPQLFVLADVSFVDCTVLSSASPGFSPQVLPDDLTPAPFVGSPSFGWRTPTRPSAGNDGASQLPDSSLVPCHALGPRQAFGSLTFYGCSVWASRIVNWVATCFHFLRHEAGLL